jgi:hypothetical protein
VRTVTAGTVGKALVALVLGVAVGTVGTLMHRSVQPWGVVVCLALVAAAGVVARAWDGWPTLGGYAVGVLGSTQLLAREGPGGDVLVPADQAIGWVWILGGVVVLLAVAVLPRRLFVDPPLVGPTSSAVVPGPVSQHLLPDGGTDLRPDAGTDPLPDEGAGPPRDPVVGTRDDAAP